MTDADLLRRRGSFVRTLRAVLGSFFGVRRGADLDRDQRELNPLHVVVAGIVVAALIVLVAWRKFRRPPTQLPPDPRLRPPFDPMAGGFPVPPLPGQKVPGPPRLETTNA